MSFATGATDYGTAIRLTRIRPHGSGYSWTRLAPHPDWPFAESQQGWDLAQPTHGSRFVIGDGDQRTRRYLLPAKSSLATAALGPSPAPDWQRTAAQWGGLLAQLHCQSADDVINEPPARSRLRDWWSLRDLADPHRSAARAGFIDHLHPASVEFIHDVVSGDLSDGVLVHGWPGLGVAVASPGGDLLAMLGEDIGRAPAEYDLGALLAQVIELALFLPADRSPNPRTTRDALLEGYSQRSGGHVNVTRLNRHVVEHIVRHVADFTAYADFAAVDLPRWAGLVNSLVRPERPVGMGPARVDGA